jgi:choline transporter-like protein 2/4/5
MTVNLLLELTVFILLLQVSLLKALGAILVCLAVLWLLVICFMRKSVDIAIGIIKESSRALLSMSFLCLFPLIQTAIFVAVTILCVYYCVYLVSAGTVTNYTDVDTGESYKAIDYDDETRNAAVLVGFSWLWIISFFDALGQMTSAHSVLIWYFSDATSPPISSRQVQLMS